MIQRIQSIYLFVAAVAAVVLMCIPIGWFETTEYGYVYTAFVVKDVTPDAGILMSTAYMGILLAISAIFSLISIFLYKNRNQQTRMIYANMFIFLLSIGLMLVIYPDYVFVKSGLIESSKDIDYNFWIILCMVITAGMLYLANRAIKSDEKKVRATDRLR
jgi:hypothetical protein